MCRIAWGEASNASEVPSLSLMTREVSGFVSGNAREGCEPPILLEVGLDHSDIFGIGARSVLNRFEPIERHDLDVQARRAVGIENAGQLLLRSERLGPVYDGGDARRSPRRHHLLVGAGLPTAEQGEHHARSQTHAEQYGDDYDAGDLRGDGPGSQTMKNLHPSASTAGVKT